MTPIALTIAGSDSGGGAGIQADLKTFSALGVYGASVVTALTAQNTKGVSAIHDVPAQFVAAQMDAVFSDLHVGAVKVGMVSQRAVIEAIAAGLERWQQSKVVVDPVMVAASGDKLLAADAIDVLKRALIPHALVLTPNLPEAAALLDAPIARNETEMRDQGERLRASRGRPHRDPKYPRHRLHAFVGDRCRPRQGACSDRGGGRRQELCDGRARRRQPHQDRLRTRPHAPFPRLVVNASSALILRSPPKARKRASIARRRRARTPLTTRYGGRLEGWGRPLASRRGPAGRSSA